MRKHIVVENLKDISPDQQNLVFINDGATNNIFLYNEDKKGINNNGTIIDGWVRQTENSYLNIKWFGVKGDGETDDTESFKKALQVSNRIYIPKGIYLINSLTFNKNNIDIKGDGVDTIIKGIHNSQDVFVFDQGHPRQENQVRISDLKFTSDKEDDKDKILNSFIRITGNVVNADINNIHFEKSTSIYCILDESSYGTTVNNCKFTVLEKGIGVYRANKEGGSKLTIKHCDFTGIDTAVLTNKNTGLISFISNVFESCRGDAIKLINSDENSFHWNIYFRECHFEANKGYDINLDNEKSSIGSHIKIESSAFFVEPKIKLGKRDTIVLENIQCSGGTKLEIIGDIYCKALLINCQNIYQSGNFLWKNIINAHDDETHANVKEFGAKGDGKTDDTEAFKIAFKYKNIYIPEGIYLINSTIDIRDNSKIYGDGSKSKIIYNSNDTNFLFKIYKSPYVLIRDISLERNKDLMKEDDPKNLGKLIYAKYSPNITIENCNFNYASHAIFLDRGNYTSKILNNKISNCITAIELHANDAQTDILISGNTFGTCWDKRNDDDHLFHINASNVRITNNYFETVNEKYCIYIDDKSQSINISENQMLNCGGIYSESSVQISNNRIFNNDKINISIDVCCDCIITSNFIQNKNDDSIGINLRDRGNIVTNNRINASTKIHKDNDKSKNIISNNL